MAETVTKLPIKQEKSSSVPQMWQPFESLRQEIDRLFNDFGQGFWRPFGRSLFAHDPLFQREMRLTTMPAVDVIESEKAYEVTAELPGMDEKNIEVKVANGVLTIRGEKAEDKEEKNKDFHMRERRFGAFERAFRIPEIVDMDKIEATFKKGVLMVKMPKTAEAQKPVKKIAVKGE